MEIVPPIMSQAATVAWRGYNGINIIWPFSVGVFSDPNADQPSYSQNPFTNPSLFAEHITSSTLDSILNNGFDCIRLLVDPGPWMEGIIANSEPRIKELFGILDSALESILNRGFHLCLAINPNSNIYYTPNSILSGLNSIDFDLFRDAIRRFADHYKLYDAKKFALELFNDPISFSDIIGSYDDYQKILYSDVRQYMSFHTIILSAPDFSNIDQFVLASKEGIDTNTLWSIHTYIPEIFTRQGFINGYNNWANAITWPPNLDQKEEIITSTTNAINEDPLVPVDQKAALIASQTTDINLYFDLPEDKTWLLSQYAFQRITDELIFRGWDRDRVIISEWGTARSGIMIPEGVDQVDRVAYATDISDVIHSLSMRSCVMALDADNYGITNGFDTSIGTFDPDLMTAIDANRLRV